MGESCSVLYNNALSEDQESNFGFLCYENEQYFKNNTGWRPQQIWIHWAASVNSMALVPVSYHKEEGFAPPVTPLLVHP